MNGDRIPTTTSPNSTYTEVDHVVLEEVVAREGGLHVHRPVQARVELPLVRLERHLVAAGEHTDTAERQVRVGVVGRRENWQMGGRGEKGACGCECEYSSACMQVWLASGGVVGMCFIGASKVVYR